MRTRVGIYVQVPFCQTKCTYCNFHTGVVSSARFAPYVGAVCREIENHQALYEAAGIARSAALRRGEEGQEPFPEGRKAVCAHREIAPSAAEAGLQRQALPARLKSCPDVALADAVVDTVYVGGGTPSLLDPEHLGRVVEAIRRSFATELAEVTLEADPETVEKEKAEAWVRAGINRVSFGVQSFSDVELAAAGRMHRRADVCRAVAILREAGIRNISFDLIAGLAHQTRGSWRNSLDELAALAPEHVSVYVLEIDEGSRLGAEVLRGGGRYGAEALPSEDEMAEFYETACEFLRQAGYHHYEISNWGKPGFESRHNLKYWRREPYLGFGAGAHSFSGAERWANAHDAAVYVDAMQKGRLPVEQHEVLTADSALEEELFLGLRQLDGIDVGRIERQYGVALASRFDPLASAGLVERSGNVVRLAAGRLSVSNEVFVELMK
jgi:oxygen-independent coproporphyrinogen-3 oxidase